MIYRAISKLISSLIYHPSSCQDTPFADDYDTVLNLIRETQVASTKVYKNFVVVALKKKPRVHTERVREESGILLCNWVGDREDNSIGTI